MTRIQDEHDEKGVSQSQYEEFCLGKKDLDYMKPHAIIMHPLPRRGEIDVSVDKDPRAMYWRQERNGMWIRAALISIIFGSDEEVRLADERFLS
jgi:aspartate carbamoyltransferase catalytic subunit